MQVQDMLIFQVDERFGIARVTTESRLPQRFRANSVASFELVGCLGFEVSTRAIHSEGYGSIANANILAIRRFDHSNTITRQGSGTDSARCTGSGRSALAAANIGKSKGAHCNQQDNQEQEYQIAGKIALTLSLWRYCTNKGVQAALPVWRGGRRRQRLLPLRRFIGRIPLKKSRGSPLSRFFLRRQ